MFHRKKNSTEVNTADCYGFSFAQHPLTCCSDRVLSCALKGLFIFAAVYGSLGGLISSFDLPHYTLILPVFLLVLSMTMAFLHYSRLIFNLFYPVSFIIFMVSIFTYRYHVYSGFQAFLNIMQEKYSAYFNLSILREANEYFSDRRITITIATIFIGFFLIVLLNIAISEYMNLPAVILLTFPIFQLGIYIDEMPDFPYLVLLLFSYFMVAILKRSDHFLLPYREKKHTEFSYKHKKNIHTWSYHASGRMMLQLAVIFFAFSFLLGIICSPFLFVSDTNVPSSALRKKADDYVKIFTQNGLSGFFNRYEASGGLSEGRLGGVSSVRPDYETDLTVTFVPFAYETLYLKAFTGQNYDGNSWQKPSYNTDAIARELGANYEDYENYTGFLEARRLAHYMEQNPGKGIFGKLRIQNVDANEAYLYLPYYANGEITTPYMVERGVAAGLSALDEPYTVNYYPLMHDYWNINPQPDEMLADLAPDSLQARYIAYYDMLNTSSYIDMPTDTRNALEKIKEEIGTAANIDAQISAIRTYLHENYTYSMMPGTTPRNADFAVHFLTQQDSGYCAHFATAGALLLRSYGIPARYVEGYVVSMRDVAQGDAVNEPYTDWFQGENPIGETGVVRVNVTDASAHAWVEVYKLGIGWVPYEFTPPDTSNEEQDTTYSDFWSIFSGIFGDTPPDAVNNSNHPLETESYFEKNFASSSFLARPMLLFLGTLFLTGLLLWILRMLITLVRLKSAYRKGNYIPLLSHHYRRLCRLLFKKGLCPNGFFLPSELPSISDSPFTEEECTHQMELLEKCCYSQHSICRSDADLLLHFLKRYRKRLKHYNIKKQKKKTSP
ncbi:MAG: transglutaminase domain-containing protein [Lachnospiraceae bacterium]|nr:transglutaminase domain-containing protein [Lachnospiraceae bacterium]